MLRILLGFAFLLALNSCSKSTHSIQSKGFSRYITRELGKSTVFSGHAIGLVISDSETGKSLTDLQGGRYFQPASNTKLFSLYAGLCVLGDSIPGIRYQISGDSLVISGTGDPSLLHPDLPRSAVLDFLKSRKEKLFFVNSNFSNPRYGPGWAWDDYNDYYQTERSALPVFGNFVRFSSDSSKAVMASPKFWQDSLQFSTHVTGIRRDEYSNRFYYSAHPLPAGLQEDIPVRMSDELMVHLLEKELGRPVGILKGALSKPYSIKYSIPSDSLYSRMMQVSDNMLAEQLMLLYASVNNLPLTTDGAIEHMKEHYLQDLPDKAVWVDGSGLSRYNLFTPRSIVALLSKIDKLVEQGRMRKIFVKPEAQNRPLPYIVAKTGSFRNNFNLSGYLFTKNGRKLTFSFMNNNFAVPVSLVRKEVERFLLAIGENY